MIRSIRVTLTLWYIGILAVILGVFSWVLYSRVESDLKQRVDERLVSQADGIADTISAFWQAEWQAKHESTLLGQEKRLVLLPRALQREINKGKFKSLIHRWATETEILDNPSRPFRIIQSNGEFLLTHPGFSRLTSSLVIKTALQESQKGQAIYETFNLPGYPIRIVTRPIIENKNLLYLVQTASSLQGQEDALDELRTRLFLFVPATLLVTSLVGWFLATMALRPVGKMIAKAQGIRANRLNERMEVPLTGDELQRLAETFNGMLSRLESAFKRLRQFSAAASHELRTPLTVMKGELEVAMRRPRDLQEYQRVLGTQLEVINEMVSIVEQLLALAHSEEGEEAIEWRPVELTDLVMETSGEWKALAEKKGVKLSFKTKENHCVRGERGLLKRLLSNLLDNAIKHTPAGGDVRVDLESHGEEACLVVSDTGSGIPAEELPKIFDKFFSRQPSSGEGQASMGIGLGLCRWIVEAHQGRIEVSSLPGEGTTFRIFLPN